MLCYIEGNILAERMYESLGFAVESVQDGKVTARLELGERQETKLDSVTDR